MKKFLKAWPKLAKQMTGKHLLLLLDYDGTLTPIRKTPVQAVLSKHVKDLLRGLLKKPDITLGIVSGRDLSDLKAKIGLPTLIYASNHGFQISGKGLQFKAFISASAKRALKKFADELLQKTHCVKGALIEKKMFSASLHYRLVRQCDLTLLNSIFQEVFEKYKRSGLEAKPGKKVIEVMPALKSTKGTAVLHILRLKKNQMRPIPVVPLYIGDDKTDEDAFRALSGTGITVKIGDSKNSFAEYHLRNPQELIKFLRMLSVQ